MIVRAAASRVEVWAPAKLNLFLEILGKRSDGYHEICTLMVPVAIYDTLLISPTEPADARADIQLSITTGERTPPRSAEHSVPATDENTVVRAIRALQARCAELAAAKTPRLELSAAAGCSISAQLHKRIPAAAGLAGGSSDAAAAIVAMAHLWGLSPADPRLTQAAADVGSDIPFFLAGGAAVCRGRGEVVNPAPLPRLHFVIARPDEGLSTAAVYQACQPGEAGQVAGRSVDHLVQALRTRAWSAVRTALYNGLQPAAESLSPAVVKLRDEFSRLDVICHQMSGSGTSYFGICASARQARQVAARLRSRRVGYVFAASSCL